jgi:hypothetical protein
MDDRDFFGLAALIAALGVLGILQARILRAHDERIRLVSDDVEFLKTYARETEAARND